MEIWQFIKSYWAIVSVIISGIVGVVILLKYKIPEMEKKIQNVESKVIGEVSKSDIQNFISKKHIYHKDGAPIYQFKAACEDSQRNCQSVICGKIDDVTKKLNEMDESREKTKGEFKYLVEQVHEQQIKMVEVGAQVRTLFANKQDVQIKSIVSAVLRELKLIKVD
jgi:hypothetical protein